MDTTLFYYIQKRRKMNNDTGFSPIDPNAVTMSFAHADLNMTANYLKKLLQKDFSELIPIRITYSPPATICYFSDGDKIVVKCASDEKYIKEVGVQACIMKKLFGSRQKFLKMVHAGYDQPTKENRQEVTKEHIQKIVNRINQIPD